MNKRALYILAGSSLGLALLAAALTFLIPSRGDGSDFAFHSLFIISNIMVVAHFGGAVLFVWGLTGFSARFKAAYGWLVAGFVSLALGFTQLPLMNLLHWESSAWSRYGLIALPFIFSIVCLYVGTRGFARLFGVKNILTSPFAATGLAIVISALSVLLPNATPNIEMQTATIQISKFAVALPAIFNLWTAILSYQARRQAGSLYIPATAWLSAYLILDSVSSMAGVVARLVQPGQNIAFDAGYMYIGYALAGVVLLKAGIEFNKIAAGRDVLLPANEQTFFGRPKVAQTTGAGVVLPDVLVYAAGLTSNVKAVDPLLDELRLVTANHAIGTPFNTAEQQHIATAYLKLERYLSEQEPVRPIAREALRSTIQAHFAPTLAANPAFAQAIVAF